MSPTSQGSHTSQGSIVWSRELEVFKNCIYALYEGILSIIKLLKLCFRPNLYKFVPSISDHHLCYQILVFNMLLLQFHLISFNGWITNTLE